MFVQKWEELGGVNATDAFLEKMCASGDIHWAIGLCLQVCVEDSMCFFTTAVRSQVQKMPEM